MPRKSKLKHATVVGVFATRSEAEAALRELRAARFTDDQIGLVARSASGGLVDEAGDTYADEGAVAGAVVGVGAGALIGLGVIAGVIPVVGPAIMAGTIGTILSNAVGGAAIAGITGALIGWGIPEDEASYYETEVLAGRFLVSVDARDRVDEAWAIVHRCGGYNRTTPAVRRSLRAAALAAAPEKAMKQPAEARARKRPAKKAEAAPAAERNPAPIPVKPAAAVKAQRPVRRKADTVLKNEPVAARGRK